MPELEIRDDAQAIVVGDFRLTFRWAGDRWAHELEHRGRSDPRHLAWSFETAPEHEEPTRVVCPAFQQLNFQEAGDKMQALLVGQSGRHHFSAVFEVEDRTILAPERLSDSSEPSRSVLIKVDVADRCREPVASLASTYRVGADAGDLSVETPASGPSELIWDLGPNRLEFTSPPAQVSFAEDGRRATRVQAVAEIRPGQFTQQWTYSWRWSPEIRRSPPNHLDP